MPDARELHGRWANFQRHEFLAPCRELAPFVARYWFATWDLRGQPPYRQLIVPDANVHLTFQGGRAAVVGVSRGHVWRELAGLGRVFGVAFRPGCFRPFLGAPVSTITGRSIDAAGVFGAGLPVRAVAGADENEMPAIVDRFLCGHLPAPDPLAERAAELVERAGEPAVLRVEDLARRANLGIRRLQRLFADYVGVNPKWVIRRHRLHEVTDRLATGVAMDWARLAAELGYADQAHFTRDFTEMFGESPTRYALRYPILSGRT